MRKLFLLCTTLIFSFGLHAQDSADIPAMKQKIDSLQKRLDDGNYTRVPKQDYENILKNTVTSEVDESIKKWIAFLGGLIGLVGVFIAAYFKNQIKTQVDESLKNKLDVIDARIDRVVQNEKDENTRQDLKLAEVTKRIDNIITEQGQFADKSNTLVDKKIKDSLSFVWDDIADSKVRLAEEKKFNGTDLIQQITDFLENKEILLRKENRIKLIDTLMRCYYNTPAKNVEEKYKNMIQLLRKYETDYELLPETYANAAIALTSSYQQSGVKSVRDSCIDCCDKSISRLKDYGEPYAIKLEVFIMDYEKAYDEKEKNEAVENIKRTFNAIKNNTSRILCLQIISRISRDNNVAALKSYMASLEKMFVDDLTSIRQRAASDIILDRKFFNLDTDWATFKEIMYNDMMKTVDTNGNWVCSKLIRDGKEIIPVDDLQNISFKDYEYSLTRNNIIQYGYVHFLPFKNITGIDFYRRIGKEDNFANEGCGIYKIENSQLIICMDDVAKQRPSEFTSTPENKYVLSYFDKTV